MDDRRRSRTVASGVALLAVGLAAWDHLWGNERGPDDAFPVDAATFFVSLGLIAVAAVVVFGITVPRATTVHRAALIHSAVALVLAVPLSWLGFPAIVAGGGIILGLRSLTGTHRLVAIAAIGVGVLVLVFAILGTAFPPSDG